MIDLDGTPNKSKLGANAILRRFTRGGAGGVQFAWYAAYTGTWAGITADTPSGAPHEYRQRAAHTRITPRFPGIHDSPAGFQELQGGYKGRRRGIHNLKAILKKRGYSTSVGDEGRVRTQSQIEPKRRWNAYRRLSSRRATKTGTGISLADRRGIERIFENWEVHGRGQEASERISWFNCTANGSSATR